MNTSTKKMSSREVRLRALQRDLLEMPHRAAKLEAEILTIELGGTTAPVAADAWAHVQRQYARYRAEVDRAGLGAS